MKNELPFAPLKFPEAGLSGADLDAIEARTAELYRLANACANKGWNVPDEVVHAYLAHINKHFPGKDVYLLLAEVQRLRELVHIEGLVEATAPESGPVS